MVKKYQNKKKIVKSRRTMSYDPPSVISEPFNHLTLAIEGPTADAWYKYSYILEKINEQLGTGITDMVIKMKSIQIWGKNDDNGKIGLEIFAPIQGEDNEPDPLKTMVDSPGKNHRATLRYKYDRIQSQQPMRIVKDVSNGFAFGIAGPVDVIHISLVWRTQVFKPVATRKIIE